MVLGLGMSHYADSCCYDSSIPFGLDLFRCNLTLAGDQVWYLALHVHVLLRCDHEVRR